MTKTSLIDRFTFHTESFQEGFDILATSSNIKDFAKQFCQILKGNLLARGVGLLYKVSLDDNWHELFSARETTGEVQLPNVATFEIIDNIPAQNNLVVILPTRTGSFFAVLIDEKLGGEVYSNVERLTIQLFALLLDNAYQAFKQRQHEKELIFFLNNRVLQLNNLIDTGIEISSIRNHNTLCELAIQRAVTLTTASKGMVKLTEEENEIDEIYFPDKFNFDKENQHSIEHTIEYQKYSYRFVLIDKESRAGIVPFDETDNLILEAITRQVSAALENDFLLEQSMEKQKIEQEISVAGDIQKTIIPERLPEIQGYDLAGIYIPSKEVGGDYYDCIPLKDGRFALMVADVTGKGIPASLMVSSLQASFYAYLESKLSISDLAKKLNKQIYKASTSDKFITACFLMLTPETGELEVMNAGHNPPLVLRSDGSLYKINRGGVAFGAVDMDLPFTSEKLTLNPGEKLLLFSDGIPEAMNLQKELYEDETLEDFFLNQSNKKAEDFITDLVADVNGFVNGAPQSDDITVLFLKREM